MRVLHLFFALALLSFTYASVQEGKSCVVIFDKDVDNKRTGLNEVSEIINDLSCKYFIPFPPLASQGEIGEGGLQKIALTKDCLLYTSPSPRD